MIRSKSKLPFCVTGEKVSRVKFPVRNDLADGGIASLFGGDNVRAALGIFCGCEGDTTPAIVVDLTDL